MATAQQSLMGAFSYLFHSVKYYVLANILILNQICLVIHSVQKELESESPRACDISQPVRVLHESQVFLWCAFITENMTKQKRT